MRLAPGETLVQRCLSVLLTLCAAVATAAGARGDAPLAVPIEGEPFSAELAGVDSAWNFKFTAADATRSVAARDLVRWGAFGEPGRGIHVVLAGGGLIVTDAVGLVGDELVGTSQTFGKWSLPIDIVAAILFRPPHDRQARDRLLDRALALAGRGDRLVLDNGDELSGTLTAMDPKQVALRGDAGPLEIKLESLSAVLFDPSLVARPKDSGLRAVVGFRDGSRLATTEMTTDGDETRLTLAGGARLAAPTDAIVALLILGGARRTFRTSSRPVTVTFRT